MSAPDVWETNHDDAVSVIVDTGNEMLDELSDVLDELAQAAQVEAEVLRAEAAAVAEVDPEEAQALEEEADAVLEAAVVLIYAAAEARAEEGSKMLLGMCGNKGQETIVSNALGDFVEICFECADEATADLAT